MREPSKYIEHPLIKPGKIEARLYQQIIAARASERNTMVVLPTGLGKTAIAIMVIAYRLHKYGGKALMMSPTRPLAIQHWKSLKNVLKIDDIVLVTGRINPERRKEIWSSGRIFVATPQVVENDVRRGLLSLEDFTLLVFDEAHRAVGSYPYVDIANFYIKIAKNPRILALTASPGGDEESISEVLRNLYIENVEVRTRESKDVAPYLSDLEIEIVDVPLGKEYGEAIELLRSAVRSKVDELRRMGMDLGQKFGMKNLLEIQKVLAAEGRGKELSIVSSIIKIQHIIDLMETEGASIAYDYLKKLMKRGKATDRILMDDSFVRKLIPMLEELLKRPHPKMDVLREIVMKHRGRKMMIFTNYRKTAYDIYDLLSKIDGVRPSVLIGQQKKEEHGMSQEEQRKILEEFISGAYNILISTSVGEEGLDLPDMDIVLLYDATPSGIRHIQRKGRVGRIRPGKVIALLSKGKEVGFFKMASRREREMERMLKRALSMSKASQLPLEERKKEKISIKIDFREISGPVARLLISREDVSIELMKINDVDYVINDRIFVSRLTQGEIMLIKDIDLYLKELRRKYPSPVILLEGDVQDDRIFELTSSLGIHLLRTRNPEDTVNTLIRVAREGIIRW
ncbi:MAG: helicase-related protein [Candidatus Methanodesulfokora sp.]